MIELFAEGKTEEQVIEQLNKRSLCAYKVEITRNIEGESQMMSKLKLRLKDWYKIGYVSNIPLTILVMRDLDTDNKKTVQDICKSTLDCIRNIDFRNGIDSKAKIEKSTDFDNLYFIKTELKGLSLALHIATEQYSASFTKTTIDDYVLKLALSSFMANKLIERHKRSDWTITPERLISKIQSEIPDLISSNGIKLCEAKDYARFLASVLRSNLSPQRLADQVLNYAEEANIREVFKALFSAVQFLGDQESNITTDKS